MLSRDPLLPAGCSMTCRTVVSSLHKMPSACCYSITCSNCGVLSGPNAQCLLLLKYLQELCCLLGTISALSSSDQGSAETVVLFRDPLPTASCSGNCRTCAVISGLISHCLPLLRYLQDLCFRLRTHCHLPAVVQVPAGPVVSSRDPQPSTCLSLRICRTCGVVRTHCLLPAATQ